MTLSEFKAWFEGFTQFAQDATPTDVQWAAIKRKVATLADPTKVVSLPQLQRADQLPPFISRAATGIYPGDPRLVATASSSLRGTYGLDGGMATGGSLPKQPTPHQAALAAQERDLQDFAEKYLNDQANQTMAGSA